MPESAVRQFFVSELCEYETPKIVSIKSKCLGIANRLVQVTIIIYLIIWVFIVNHGYQYIDKAAISVTTTKVKGVSYTNSSDIRIGNRIWDMADLVVPPQESGALFITTNAIVTHNQTQGICTETEGIGANCSADSDCQPIGKPYHLSYGISEGTCNHTTGTCVVRAWCPIEDDSSPKNEENSTMKNIGDFTVFVNSHVHFPFYDKARSSLIEFIDKDYLHRCNYHPTDDPYCPVFRVGDIISLAEAPTEPISDSHFRKMAVKGGVITINIAWDCNFDYKESKCKPSYAFKRLDTFNGNSLASGYNFRHPIYFYESNRLTRHLVKAYGILFTVITDAQARRFNIITFLQNLGSGLALLGIASICCDLILLYCHRHKNYFKENKFQTVEQLQGLDMTTIRELLRQHMVSSQEEDKEDSLDQKDECEKSLN